MLGGLIEPRPADNSPARRAKPLEPSPVPISLPTMGEDRDGHPRQPAGCYLRGEIA